MGFRPVRAKYKKCTVQSAFNIILEIGLTKGNKYLPRFIYFCDTIRFEEKKTNEFFTKQGDKSALVFFRHEVARC